MLEDNLGQKKLKLRKVALAESPYQASHQSSFYYDGKIYVAGGLNNSTVSTSDFSCYDISKDLWTSLTAMPGAARTAGLGGYSGKLSHIGGYNQGPGTSLTAIRQFLVGGSAWTTSSAVLAAGSYEFAAETFADGRMFLFGGRNNSALLPQPTVFDLTKTTPTSTTLTADNSVSRIPGSYSDGTRYVYLLGGMDLAVGLSKKFRRYDALNNSWTTYPDCPVGSHYSGLLLFGSEMYAIISNPDGVYKNVLYKFSFTTNTWSFVGDLDGPVHALSKPVRVGDELFLIGGWTGSTRTSYVSKLTPH